MQGLAEARSYSLGGHFKNIRFYSGCNGKPLKVLNRGAWNAVYIFNGSLWLLFGEWIEMGARTKVKGSFGRLGKYLNQGGFCDDQGVNGDVRDVCRC